MVRAATTALGVFTGVAVVLLVAVGQAGGLDAKSVVAVLGGSLVAAAVAGWRMRRS